MHSTEKLAEALRGAGLTSMALKAKAGYYHDFLSPLDTPCLQLAQDLRAFVDAPSASAETRSAAALVLGRHMAGEFDATKEESDAWAASPEGMKTMAALIPPLAEPEPPATPAPDLPTQIARLALRVEGDFWVAYLAPAYGMQGATVLAKVLMTAVADPRHKMAFMALMRNVVGDIIEANTGHRPIWPQPEGRPADERERHRSRP
jgi:hypothetical protein